ncbi:MAG: hypothetical protein ACK50A_10445 [Sphingobacteriaceae bacterium]
MKLKFTFSIVLSIIFCALKAQTSYVKMLKEDTTTWQHFGIQYGVRMANLSSTIAPKYIYEFNCSN